MFNAAFPLDIEAADITKHHVFELGPNETGVIIEWKFYIWTEGGLVPSAKMTMRHEAMYAHNLAPLKFRKIVIS